MEDSANPSGGAEDTLIAGLMGAQEPSQDDPKAEDAPEEDAIKDEPEGDELEDNTVVEDEEEAEEAEEAEEEVEDLYPITVNGEKKEVPLDELKALAQKGEDYTQKTQQVSEQRREVDEQRRQVEQEKREVQTERERYINEFSSVIETMKADIGEGEKVDLNALADEDPVEANRQFLKLQQKKEQLKDAETKRQELFEKDQSERMRQYEEFKSDQVKRIIEALPELSDPVKASEAQSKVTAYLKGSNFNPQEIDGLVDSRLWLAINKARMWDELQASKPGIRKKVAKIPKIIKSGAPKSNKEKQTGDRDKMKNNLKQSGRVEDLAALLLET